MNDDGAPNVAELLDAERRRAAKPEETLEQHVPRLARKSWHENVESVWLHAHLMEAAELGWFAAVPEASETTGTRKVHRWSRGTRRIARATTTDNAIRLDQLQSVLWKRDRHRDNQRRLEDRGKVALALRELGWPAPKWFAWTEDNGAP